MARQLKIAVIIGFFVTAFSGLSSASSASNPTGDGKLSLYSYHANEAVEVMIHRDGRYDAEELAKVDQVMRCRGNNSIYKMDRRLIDLLDHLQDKFGADTIEIISGYRSPAFNHMLKQEGHHVARESLHTKGLAIDIHIDEVSEKAVWEYVKSLGVGGVGYYPCYDFVHIDVGRKAAWAEADCAERKLVGLDLNPNPDWQITTNKNNYRRSDIVTFTVNSSAVHLRGGKEPSEILLRGGPLVVWRDSSKVYSDGARTAPAHLEKFRRGIWKKQKDIDFESKKFSAADLPYGKYRIVYEINPPAYSNEFYIKKL